MEQLNNQFELEKIKKKLLMTYTRYNGTNIPYTDEEMLKAAILIKSFFDKLDNMLIYEDNMSRKLNNLELFVAMYEFVADRVYVEQDTSHDIIGTLITNKGVCQGYCQLMSFLCESFNIPFLYKNSEIFDENKNPIGSHGNFEVIVQDENGFYHCLHCDPTIDSPKHEADILGFNAFLIHDSDINRYYHKQILSGNGISIFYNNFLDEHSFEHSISLLSQVNPIEQMTSGKTEEEIINGHFTMLKNNLVELNNFFRLNIDFNGFDNFQLIGAYRAMYEYYNSIAQPFSSDELKQAIKNVKTSEFMYQYHLSFADASMQSQQIFEQRMTKSVYQQEKYWKNDGGKSFMFMEVKSGGSSTMK